MVFFCLFIQTNTQDVPLYTRSTISASHAHLMITTFVLCHKVNGVALQDLLTLFNMLLPGVSPSSKFLFEKKFADIQAETEIHFYCHNCSAYIGPAGQAVCPNENRKAPVNIEEYKKRGIFFLYLPLVSQLKDLLENHNVVASLIDKCEHITSESMEDIFDGNEMKRLVLENNLNSNDLTLVWNSDSVPVFESSGYSNWPVQVLVNELPPELRKKHVLFSALWFGKSQPSMDTVLTRMVEEGESLAEEGFWWTNPKTHKQVHSRAFFVASACDAVARPHLKNSVQFNSMYGCDWCVHPGEVVRKGSGHARVYPFSLPEPEART